MKNQSYLDCLLLMGTAVSLKLPEMNRPLIQDVFTTVVKLSLTVDDILLDDKNLVLKLVLLLNQNWLDPRLGADVQTRQMAVSGKIWDPKITNINGDQLNENLDETVFWRGYGDGNITLNRKLKLKIQCTTFFADFPFDTQFCEIKFGSYRFPKDEVTLEWENITPIIFKNQIKSLEFSLSNVSTEIVTDVRPSGSFSSALVQFTIKRNPKHYLISSGLPCTIMITLSYLSVWMKSQKILLNSLSVLVHLFFYHLSTCSQPVPYFKRLDLLVGSSWIFSLLLLIKSIIFEKNENQNKVSDDGFKVGGCLKRNWVEFLNKLSLSFYYIILLLSNYMFL